MKIAIITAGGAGMFCGSCMQDNTLARALRGAGADAFLLPTYTPIRVDEADESSSRVFLGGINVWMDSAVPGWRFLPRFATKLLDRPGVISRLAMRFAGTDASRLGPLTIDMLKGDTGPQRREMSELVDCLCQDLKPDVVVFSNALLSGIVPMLRRHFHGRLVCLLQGDDVFLDALPDPWRREAERLMADNARAFDLILTHSDYYARFMQERLSLPQRLFRMIPLLIESNDPPASALHHEARAELTVGYFARICPEKGAFRFLDAVGTCARESVPLRFLIGGYLPAQHKQEFSIRLNRLNTEFPGRVSYVGSPDTRDAKFELLRSFDWLCVPSPYREPKGLPVLEAALAGVPSLLPSHGAFPERIAALGYGRLYDPAVANTLEASLRQLATEPRTTALTRSSLQTACLAAYGISTGGRRILETLSAE